MEKVKRKHPFLLFALKRRLKQESIPLSGQLVMAGTLFIFVKSFCMKFNKPAVQFFKSQWIPFFICVPLLVR